MIKQGKIHDFVSSIICLILFQCIILMLSFRCIKGEDLFLLWAIIKTKQTVLLQINPGFFKYSLFLFSYKTKLRVETIIVTECCKAV